MAIRKFDPDRFADLSKRVKKFSATVRKVGPGVMENRDTDTPLPTDPNPRLIARVEKRRLIELQKAQNAAERIGRLPEPGEIIFRRMSGDYDGYDFVPALLALLGAPIEEMLVSTLSWNARVAERLLALIDAGQIGRVTFLSSEMFKGKEARLTEWLAAELTRRGSRFDVRRNHTKLILARAGARRIVIQGSMNWRRCHCTEQFSISNDAELFDWHAAYIRGDS